MAWVRHDAPGDIETALESLPDEWVVTALGPAHVVLGPTGAQVVALDDGTDGAPHTVGRLATAVRDVLAEQVPLMPFVHAFLVTDRTEPCPPATRVHPALLARALVDGPPLLSDGDLERLRSCIDDGVLDRVEALASPFDLSRPA